MTAKHAHHSRGRAPAGRRATPGSAARVVPRRCLRGVGVCSRSSPSSSPRVRLPARVVPARPAWSTSSGAGSSTSTRQVTVRVPDAADTFVNFAARNRNYNTSDRLVASAAVGSRKIAYLRFTLPHFARGRAALGDAGAHPRPAPHGRASCISPRCVRPDGRPRGSPPATTRSWVPRSTRCARTGRCRRSRSTSSTRSATRRRFRSA